MKKVICALLAMLMAFSLCACGAAPAASTPASTAASAAPASTPATDGTFTIGWSVYNAAYEFFIDMQNGVVDKCKELGIEVLTHDQKGDETEMITGCQNLIAQGIDALVISPCKPEAMNTIVELAHEKKIPVIIVDIGDGDSDKDAIIISDVFGGGQIAGKYALDLIKEKGLTSKNAAIIKCEASAVYAIRRGEGFKDIVTKAGMTVVKEITANSEQDEGYTAMQDILATYAEDLSVVFCENDNMALGAAQAVDEAGLTGKILVIGFNADATAVEAIKDGIMQGTIAQQPHEMGAMGAELANTLLTGGTITYDDDTTKEIYADVYLVDATGEKNDSYKAG
ncbi:MAG: substrate-binding domain-containing protein [Ruthenibacterium sp.]